MAPQLVEHGTECVAGRVNLLLCILTRASHSPTSWLLRAPRRVVRTCLFGADNALRIAASQPTCVSLTWSVGGVLPTRGERQQHCWRTKQLQNSVDQYQRQRQPRATTTGRSQPLQGGVLKEGVQWGVAVLLPESVASCLVNSPGCESVNFGLRLASAALNQAHSICCEGVKVEPPILSRMRCDSRCDCEVPRFGAL